jgi:sugar (glycoside-pentoside-hexuronide) transporter
MAQSIVQTDNKVGKAASGKLPFGVKFGYGGGEGAYSLIWAIFYIFFLYFLTDVVLVDPATAGLILGIGTLWDAITDPLAGIISDKIKTRWGRRRPFLLVFAIPFAINGWLLFTDFGLSPAWTVAYFIFVIMLFFTVSDYMIVPYGALGAEMTQDYDERMSLVSYRMGWSYFVTILGSALPLILVKILAENLGSEKIGWSVMAGGFALLSIFPILLTWRVTRGYELFPKQTIRISPRDITQAVFKNRPFLFTMGLTAFGIAAVGVSTSVAIYFMTYYMGFGEGKSSFTFLLSSVCSLIWIPLINYCSSRWGKRLTYILFGLLWVLVSGIGVMLVGPKDEILWYLVIVFLSIGGSCVYMIAWSMVPDCTEVDEFKTGQRREGLYYGIATFVQKASTAIALGLAGAILGWGGYVANVPQSESALLTIRLLLALGVAILAIISIVLCFFSPMTREKHAALRTAIEHKKAGEDWDEASIRGLV